MGSVMGARRSSSTSSRAAGSRGCGRLADALAEQRIGAPEVRRSKGQRWRSATGDVQANGSGADSVRATVVGPAEPDE